MDSFRGSGSKLQWNGVPTLPVSKSIRGWALCSVKFCETNHVNSYGASNHFNHLSYLTCKHIAHWGVTSTRPTSRNIGWMSLLQDLLKTKPERKSMIRPMVRGKHLRWIWVSQTMLPQHAAQVKSLPRKPIRSWVMRITAMGGVLEQSPPIKTMLRERWPWRWGLRDLLVSQVFFKDI